MDQAGDDVSETIRGLWSSTTDVLGDRQHARWICEVATSLDGDEFLAALDEPVAERMVAHLESMVARYRTGEPLQYVLGRWGFRHLDLAVDRRVLIPRPETEQVVDVVLEKVHQIRVAEPDREIVIADLGTGSGAIGLALASELPLRHTTVWITDASPDALDVARSNLAGIGRAAANVHIGSGRWFEALPRDLLCDVIVSNPPYVAVGSPELEAQVADWEPTAALLSGADGLDDIREIVAGAPGRLRSGGAIVVEIGADQGAAVREVLSAGGFHTVSIRQDLAGRDRVATGSIA